MVEISVTSSPGTSRTVTFQPEAGFTTQETEVLNKIISVFPLERPEAVLALIRKQPANLTTEELISRVGEIVVENTKPSLAPVDEDSVRAVVAMETDNRPSGSRDTRDQGCDMQPDSRRFQQSLNVSSPKYTYLPDDREKAIRQQCMTAGLKNSGNTCWFNSLTQLMYSLPAFRSLIFQCVPYGWKEKKMVGVSEELKLKVTLLLELRSLLAQLRFTEITFLEAGKILQTIDSLCLLTGTGANNGESTIGQQQDASEMLLCILDWIDKAFHGAMECRLNPQPELELESQPEPEQPLHNSIEDNFVVAESTKRAPNSDFAGIAPPAYDSPSLPGGSAIVREAQTRDNSPMRVDFEKSLLIPPPPPRSSPPKDDSAAGSSSTERSAPPPQKMARREPTEEVDQEERELVKNMKETFRKIFQGTHTQVMVSPDNVVTSNEFTSNPQLFNLHVSYGNLHDALEAQTFEPERNSQNLYNELPAVLFVGLSRFVYSNGASKLHDKFTFPQTLFMDRYMKCNEEKIIKIREQLTVLREELSRKRAHRKGMTQYPHGAGGQARLIDVFKTVYEAITNQRSFEEPSAEGSQAQEQNNRFIGPLPYSVYNKSPLEDKDKASSYVKDLGKIFPQFAQSNFPQIEKCVEVLQQAMTQLSLEETNCINEEQSLEQQIEKVYDEEDLQKHEYRLHGIIVHKGEAARGHYYTFLKNVGVDGSEVWEWLNDDITTTVPWSTVEEHSFGKGDSDKQAYLIMYVRSDAEWLMADDRLTVDESYNNLPDDLQLEVLREQGEWHDELQRFRESKKPSTQASQEKAGMYNWCGYQQALQEQGEGDENANPTGRTNKVSDRLSEQQLVFDEIEIRHVENHSGLLFSCINRVDPRRFSDPEDCLNKHLAALMNGEDGGIRYIEKHLSYPLKELYGDAENDIDNIYNKFICDFIPDMLETFDYRSRCVFYAHGSEIHPAVIRFLLVTAMANSEECFLLQKRAKQELEDFKAARKESFSKMQKAAQFLAITYEVGCLATWCCRSAIERFKKIYKSEITDEATIRENMFLGLRAARNARSLARLLSRETLYIKPGGIHFLKSGFIEMCSFPILLIQAKRLFEAIIDTKNSLDGMSFHLSSTDAPVTSKDIIEEVGRGFSFVGAWKNTMTSFSPSNSDTTLSQSDALLRSPLNNTTDPEGVFVCLDTVMGLLADVGSIQSSGERVDCLNSLKGNLMLAEEEDVRSLEKMSTHPENIYFDLTKIKHWSRELDPVDELLFKLIDDISKTISSNLPY